MQGFGKFGFYEIFKDVYRNAAGGENSAGEKRFRTLGFAVSSACAELIADCFLCPWEAVSTFVTPQLINFTIDLFRY